MQWIYYCYNKLIIKKGKIKPKNYEKEPIRNVDNLSPNYWKEKSQILFWITEQTKCKLASWGLSWEGLTE